MLKEGYCGHDPPPPDTTQDFLINRTPVDGFPDVPIVLGIPLLTLFALFGYMNLIYDYQHLLYHNLHSVWYLL